MMLRLIFFVIAYLSLAFAVALYLSVNFGISAADMIPILVSDKTGIQFRWCKVAFEYHCDSHGYFDGRCFRCGYHYCRIPYRSYGSIFPKKPGNEEQSMTGNTKKKGILLMLLSALLFSAMQVIINITGQRVPLMEQVFFRNIISLLISFVIIKRHGLSMFGERKYQPLLFMRSSFGLLGLVSLFYAASRASQADVTILSKLSPFLITLFAFIFLKEKIAKIQIPALIIAFAGAFMVANPAFNSNVFPLFLAFLCAIFASVSYTLLAYFKDKVDAVTVIMHFSTFCAAVSLPFFIMDFTMPSVTDFLLLLLMGIFGGFGQIALTYAYRMAPASEVSIYNYSGILFSMLLGYIVLGETVSYTSLMGAALVVLASLLTYRYSRHPVE